MSTPSLRLKQGIATAEGAHRQPKVCRNPCKQVMLYNARSAVRILSFVVLATAAKSGNTRFKSYRSKNRKGPMPTNQLQESTAPRDGSGSTEERSGVLPKEVILGYEFPDLVHRIHKDLNLPARQAHALFKDMLQFLYVCGSNRGERPPFYPPRYIDEAWHTFLLFTREYDAFCRYHFGTFIHHSPVTPTNRAKHKDTPKNLVFPIAREIFGELSDNWKIDAADCPQSCSPSHDDHG